MIEEYRHGTFRIEIAWRIQCAVWASVVKKSINVGNLDRSGRAEIADIGSLGNCNPTCQFADIGKIIEWFADIGRLCRYRQTLADIGKLIIETHSYGPRT